MVHKHIESITAVAGSGATNTPPIDGDCKFLYIEPATLTTTYKVNITDDDNDTVKSWDWTKGVLKDRIPMIMHGVYTVNITDATANEEFSIKMLVEEFR